MDEHGDVFDVILSAAVQWRTTITTNKKDGLTLIPRAIHAAGPEQSERWR